MSKLKLPRQIAALSARVAESGSVEICLVTSQETGRWIIPKGGLMHGLSEIEAAKIEAREEAGLQGKLWLKPLSNYHFWRRGDAVRKREVWRRDYNEMRPHSAIGNKPPISLVNRSPHHRPSVISTDENRAYNEAIASLRKEGRLPPNCQHRQVKFLNNRLESDHGKLKQRIRPVRGLKSRKTAHNAIRGFEVMRMFRKGQFRSMLYSLAGGSEARYIGRCFRSLSPEKEQNGIIASR